MINFYITFVLHFNYIQTTHIILYIINKNTKGKKVVSRRELPTEVKTEKYDITVFFFKF